MLVRASDPVRRARFWLRRLCNVAMAVGTLTGLGCGGRHRTSAQLDLYLMSDCPFSVSVVRELLPVLDRLGDEVDLKVHFIARREGDTLVSMYGPGDLTRDRLSLCTVKHEGTAGWRKLMKCQLAYSTQNSDAWRACGDAAGLRVESLVACANGAEGEALLRKSVDDASKAQIDASPTLLVNGRRYENGRVGPIIARDLCAIFGKNAPEYCSRLPASVPVEVTVVTDSRCQNAACDTDRVVQFARSTIPGAIVHKIDWSRPEAKAVYRQSGQTTLPIVVFSSSLQKEAAAFEQLRGAGLASLPSQDGFVLSMGGDFRPDPG